LFGLRYPRPWNYPRNHPIRAIQGLLDGEKTNAAAHPENLDHAEKKALAGLKGVQITPVL
jgi:hypothetical protein